MDESQDQNRPPKLTGSEHGSWAHYSIVQRLPEIGRRVIAENDYPPEIVNKLEAFYQEIPSGKIAYLKSDPGGDDLSIWNSVIEQYLGCNWLEAPWFFIEFYFYRRILEITGYFLAPFSERCDPFQYQKDQGFASSISLTEGLLAKIEALIIEQKNSTAILEKLLLTDLWGNQVDLSIWPADGEGQTADQEAPSARSKYVVNQLNAFLGWFQAARKSRVDIFIDNAGYELLCDLMLVDYLLSGNSVQQIVLHVKPYPIFVSDVMEKDIVTVIERLARSAAKNLSALASRLRNSMKEGSLRIFDNLFWGLPIPMWDMPKEINAELTASDLVISKGDANYRRLLGDRAWPFDAPLNGVLSYMPSSLLVLRVLKSEIGAGYPPDRIQEIAAIDNLWMQNGQWGSIQFFNR